MLGSQTQKVLQHTTIPVLVSAVESNLPDSEIARAAHDHPRRAPLARRGHPRPRIRRPPGARSGNAAVVSAAARDAALHRGVSGEAASSEGRRVPVPQAARAHAANSTRRSTSCERQHVDGHAARRGACAEHRRLRGGSARRPGAVRGGGRALCDIADPAHDARSPRSSSRRARASDREDWAEIGAAFASNGDPRFSVDNDEEFRQLFVRIINLAHGRPANAPEQGRAETQ